MKKYLLPSLIALAFTPLSTSANGLSVLEQHATSIDTGYCAPYISDISNELFDGTIDHTVNTMFHNDFKTIHAIYTAEFSDRSSKNGIVSISGEGGVCNVNINETITVPKSCVETAMGMGGTPTAFGSSTLIDLNGTKFVLTPETTRSCAIIKNSVYWIGKGI